MKSEKLACLADFAHVLQANLVNRKEWLVFFKMFS